MRSSVVLACLLVAATAHADVALHLWTTRFAIAPSQDGQLGLDLAVHGPSGEWGSDDLHHRLELSSFDAPDVADHDLLFFHFLRYDLAHTAGPLTVHAGVRGMTLWSDELRFATPVAGIRVAAPRDLALAVEVSSAALFLASLRDTRRHLGDLALDASAVWPAHAATRAELHVRARDYAYDDAHTYRDITASAGVGFALAHRRPLRAMPAFFGLGIRRDQRDAMPTHTTVFAIAELSFGIARD